MKRKKSKLKKKRQFRNSRRERPIREKRPFIRVTKEEREQIKANQEREKKRRQRREDFRFWFPFLTFLSLFMFVVDIMPRMSCSSDCKAKGYDYGRMSHGYSGGWCRCSNKKVSYKSPNAKPIQPRPLSRR